MSGYYGMLSYPHGGRVSAFLLLSMACGVVCTCYSISSCRFLTLDFQSNMGDFDQHFYERDPQSNYTSYRVGVGLFTWMRPFDTLDWTSGACAGYNELQRDVILDEMFDILRITGILSVVLAVSLFLFTLSISCLAFSTIQRFLMTFAALVIAALTASAFLMTGSGICTEVGIHPNCSIDQGALVAMAGVVVWILTALIGCFFVQPVPKGKLSPRMMQKRKKELRKRQVDMLKQLEILEMERKIKIHRRRDERAPESPKRNTTIQTSTGKPSPARSTTSTQQSGSSAPPSPRRTPPKQSIPEHLPENKKKPTSPQRENKQLQPPPRSSRSPRSPPRSPRSSESRSRGQSSGRLFQLMASRQQGEEVEAVYKERARPMKKRRIRGASKKSWLSDEEESIEEPEVKRLHRPSSRIVFEDEWSKSCEALRQKQKQQPREFDAVFANPNAIDSNALWPMLAPKTNARARPLDPPESSPKVRTVDPKYALPEIFCRDVSTVVSEQDAEEDVEVYITDTLDKIDDMIDDRYEV